jgi:hypothetical protein
MRMDANTEQKMSDARAKHRQDKQVPFLIRDDGMLYPNTPLMRRNPRFRPYIGDVRASKADRMRFLQGLGAKRAVVYKPEPEEPFDIGKATLDQLLNFAMEQFGRVLDPNKPIKKLREEVFALSQLPDPLSPEADAILAAGAQTAAAADQDGEDEDDDPAIARAAALAGQQQAAVVGALGLPEGQAMEAPKPLRGGRQPRGTTPGAPRVAGTKAAATAAAA